jgi:hypothetical protein
MTLFSYVSFSDPRESAFLSGHPHARDPIKSASLQSPNTISKTGQVLPKLTDPI